LSLLGVECTQEQGREIFDGDEDASGLLRPGIQLDIKMLAVTKKVIARDPANSTDGF